VKAFPESAFVLDWHARWFQSQGRMTEAVEETERALALDPLSAAISSDAAAQYVSLEQLARAIPFAQKAVDLSPNDPAARAALANVLLLAGEKRSRGKSWKSCAIPAPRRSCRPLKWHLSRHAWAIPQGARQLLDAAEDLPDDQLLPAVEYAGLAGVH
jgi:tetratricopeptide (TPR) repeat protein